MDLRKEFSLKTCDCNKICQKAADLDAVWYAPNKEVAFTPERLSKVHDFKLRDEFLQPNRLRKRQNATNCSLPAAWSKKQGIQLPQVILTFLPD